MSVYNENSFEGITKTKCDYCGKDVIKWINVIPGGNLCINCAHTTMRILFQDIIQYHNGTSISLLDIMFHGSKDENGNKIKEWKKPNGKYDKNTIQHFHGD